ncbi:MAG: hypothetical protein KAT34_21430 [Candidatus Aminicenantes bacterium]|nr:hypothetical protein [Candidatus Aminicenantes bacterium]
MELGIVLGIAGLLVTVAALCFAIYTHLNKSVTNKKPGSRCLNRYRKSLRMELGRIGVVGPGFETITAPTRETFTYLRISEAGRGARYSSIAGY